MTNFETAPIYEDDSTENQPGVVMHPPVVLSNPVANENEYLRQLVEAEDEAVKWKQAADYWCQQTTAIAKHVVGTLDAVCAEDGEHLQLPDGQMVPWCDVWLLADAQRAQDERIKKLIAAIKEHSTHKTSAGTWEQGFINKIQQILNYKLIG